jgi:hypothetical protein
MRRVKKNLCRNSKGKFTRCRGKSSGMSGLGRARSCKYGVSKTTGKCLKSRRKRRR